jgi:hypothetical protein
MAIGGATVPSLDIAIVADFVRAHATIPAQGHRAGAHRARRPIFQLAAGRASVSRSGVGIVALLTRIQPSVPARRRIGFACTPVACARWKVADGTGLALPGADVDWRRGILARLPLVARARQGREQSKRDARNQASGAARGCVLRVHARQETRASRPGGDAGFRAKARPL